MLLVGYPLLVVIMLFCARSVLLTPGPKSWTTQHEVANLENYSTVSPCLIAIYWIRLEKVKYACRMPVVDRRIPITDAVIDTSGGCRCAVTGCCCGCISINFRCMCACWGLLVLISAFSHVPSTEAWHHWNNGFPTPYSPSFPNLSHPLARTLHPVSSFHCCFASNGTGVTRTSKATLEAGWLSRLGGATLVTYLQHELRDLSWSIFQWTSI